MRTDRELLELAAKAAGVDVKLIDKDGRIDGYDANGEPIVLKGWNPLTDDGDALRLAVKAGIEISEGFDDEPTAYAGYFLLGTARQRFACEPHSDDPCAAARRAIVRAAAEIGMAMP